MKQEENKKFYIDFKESERRKAFEEQVKEEVPKLKNIHAVLASDYFTYGWEAALALVDKQKKIS